MRLAAGSIWGLSTSPLVWEKNTKTPAVHSCLDESRHCLEGKKKEKVSGANEVKLLTRTQEYMAGAKWLILRTCGHHSVGHALLKHGSTSCSESFQDRRTGARPKLEIQLHNTCFWASSLRARGGCEGLNEEGETATVHMKENSTQHWTSY